MPDPIRRAPTGAVYLFIAAHFVLITVVNLVFFAGGVFRPLAEATNGWITGTLIANGIFLIVLVGLVMLIGARLRPYDVGLIRANVLPAIGFTAALWLLAQAVHLIAALLDHGQVTLLPAWSAQGASVILGALSAQLFGNALFEEIAYRGFLFPQFFLIFSALRRHRWLRCAAALGASQAVFALSHIPNRIYLGVPLHEIALDLIMLTGWGLLYTLIYLRTDNLFLAVGVHALGNAPTTLFESTHWLSGEGASFLIYVLVIIWMFIIPMARAAWRNLRTQQDALADEFDAAFAAGD